MGYFTPASAIGASSTITSAWMNVVTNDANFLGAGGGTSVARDCFAARTFSAGSATAAGVAAATIYSTNTEIFDAANGHSETTNRSRYTCQLTQGTGIYLLTGRVSAAFTAGYAPGTDTLVGQFYRNGTALPATLTRIKTSASPASNEFSVKMPLAYTTLTATEYVELFVVGSFGFTPTDCTFSVDWVGYKA